MSATEVEALDVLDKPLGVPGTDDVAGVAAVTVAEKAPVPALFDASTRKS